MSKIDLKIKQMNNINEMIEVFDEEIYGNTVFQALIHERLYYKCLKAILRNYYPGNFPQEISSNESMGHVYAVADACVSCINSLPKVTKDSNV